MSKQTIECATLCGTTQLSHDFTAVRPADEQDYFLVNFSSRKCAQKSNPERSLHPFFFFPAARFPVQRIFFVPSDDAVLSQIFTRTHRERALCVLDASMRLRNL
jgi:hypothetical protein